MGTKIKGYSFEDKCGHIMGGEKIEFEWDWWESRMILLVSSVDPGPDLHLTR